MRRSPNTPGDEEMWTQYSEAEARIVDLRSGPHPCPGNPEFAGTGGGPSHSLVIENGCELLASGVQ
jgi:hypothetical protein